MVMQYAAKSIVGRSDIVYTLYLSGRCCILLLDVLTLYSLCTFLVGVVYYCVVFFSSGSGNEYTLPQNI